MKMLMAVVPKKNGDDLLSLLVNAGYTATFSETRGGMLRQSQLSLFIAVKAADVPKVLGMVRDVCRSGVRIHQGFGLPAPLNSVPQEQEEEDPSDQPAYIGSSGAVVFIWSLDSFELP